MPSSLAGGAAATQLRAERTPEAVAVTGIYGRFGGGLGWLLPGPFPAGIPQTNFGVWGRAPQAENRPSQQHQDSPRTITLPIPVAGSA